MKAPRWRPAYIGVGSNLEGPEEQVARAISRLNSISNSMLVLQSGSYRSAPMGPVDQPDFINAVIAIMTKLEPRALLAELQAIETAQGRVRDGTRWGPRIIDLDLLALGDVMHEDEALVLPHPGIAERNFVLLPWAEIAPCYQVPGLASVAELSRAIVTDDATLEKIT